jgi:hypothetical protein
LPYDVFSDAYVDTGIYIITKEVLENYTSLVCEYPSRYKNLSDLASQSTFEELSSEEWNSSNQYKFVTSSDYYRILQKVTLGSERLGNLSKSIRGILASSADLSSSFYEDLKPLFVGDVYRYQLNNKFVWVKYGQNLKEKPNDYSWFQNERILVRRLINRQFRIMATLANEEFVNKKDLYVLKITDSRLTYNYTLALLNSRLFSYLKTKGSTSASKDDFSQLTLSDIRELPIKILSLEEQSWFAARVDKILEGKAQLSVLSMDFVDLLAARYTGQLVGKRIEDWAQWSFSDLIKEFKKSKINISLEEQSNLLRYFESEKSKVELLTSKVLNLELEIDMRIMDLYGLNKRDEDILYNFD